MLVVHVLYIMSIFYIDNFPPVTRFSRIWDCLSITFSFIEATLHFTLLYVLYFSFFLVLYHTFSCDALGPFFIVVIFSFGLCIVFSFDKIPFWCLYCFSISIFFFFFVILALLDSRIIARAVCFNTEFDAAISSWQSMCQLVSLFNALI